MPWSTCSLTGDATSVRGLHTAAGEEPPLAAAREKPDRRNKDPAQPKTSKLEKDKGRPRDRAYFMLSKNKQPATRRRQDGAREESGHSGQKEAEKQGGLELGKDSSFDSSKE